MIRRQGNKIVLDGTIQYALNFKDPALSDEDFIVTLIEELYQSDVAIRVGTSNKNYEKKCFQHAAAIVLDRAAMHHGIDSRNQIITEVFNKMTNTRPTYMIPFICSPFLAGSDLAALYSNYSKPVSP